MDENNQSAESADNHKPTEIPISDPEESLETAEGPEEEPSNEPSISAYDARPRDPFVNSGAQKGSKKVPLILAVCLLTVVAVVFVVLTFFKPGNSNDSNSNSDSGSGLQTVYTTPADSTDPEGDYIAYLEQKVSSATNAREKYAATMNLSEYLLSVGRTSQSVAVLDTLSPADFTTDYEYYTYYTFYARIYSPTFLDQPDLYAEYTALADSVNPSKSE